MDSGIEESLIKGSDYLHALYKTTIDGKGQQSIMQSDVMHILLVC